MIATVTKEKERIKTHQFASEFQSFKISFFCFFAFHIWLPLFSGFAPTTSFNILSKLSNYQKIGILDLEFIKLDLIELANWIIRLMIWQGHLTNSEPASCRCWIASAIMLEVTFAFSCEFTSRIFHGFANLTQIKMAIVFPFRRHNLDNLFSSLLNKFMKDRFFRNWSKFTIKCFISSKSFSSTSDKSTV